MTYPELQKLTPGKKFIRQSDLKEFTRMEFFFATSRQEMKDALQGDERQWRILNKTGWADGNIMPGYKDMLLHH